MSKLEQLLKQQQDITAAIEASDVTDGAVTPLP